MSHNDINRQSVDLQ